LLKVWGRRNSFNVQKVLWFVAELGLDIERPALPNVEAWRRRLQDRPGYRDHVMVPFEDMRGRLDY
jgi:glutathione S-transferase